MAHIDRVNSLRNTAALWHERASAQTTPTEIRDALNTWLSESPEHAAAYHSIERTWSQLQSASDDPAVLALRHDTAQRLPVASTTPHAWRWAAASLIVLSLGVVLWLTSRAALNLPLFAWFGAETHTLVTQSYATKTGDRLTVTLTDGSKVTLNTETQMDVAFSKKSRTVRLLRGQALFEVTKDKSRPFVVQTQNRRFIAVGTTFDVYIDKQDIKVTMLEGTVRAESIETGSPVQTTVTAGEQLLVGAHAADRVRRVDPERETSWRHGQVSFDNTPLGDAIDELNRYSSKHIMLADPRLADLRLSGTFATGETSTFVEAVTAYFPIRIERVDEHSVTLKGRE